MDKLKPEDYHFLALEKDLSINLNDTLKINKSRFESLYRAMNQNGATVFLAVGLHFDKLRGMAFPVISGLEWIDREHTVTLLQEAIVALNTKMIEDAQKKPL